jgi:NAD(P)H-dependent FMN reductase
MGRTVSLMQLLGISGSLRAASTNSRLIAAARDLAPSGVSLHIARLLRDLPAFDPDVAVDSIPVVSQWVQEIRATDGLVISTPEYARGYPGSLKNALDWLVGTDAFVAKPFMLLNASSRSTVAQQTLTTVLETMSGIHVSRASVMIPLLGTTFDAVQIRHNDAFAGAIQAALSTFVDDIRSRTAGV